MVHLAGGVGATSRIHDSAGVGVPLRGIDGDGHGAVLLEGGDEAVGVLSAGLEALALLLAVSPVGDGSSGEGGEGGGAGSGDALSRGVGVVGVLAHAAGGLDVLKGVRGKASVAALVDGVAGHELLGGELSEGVSGDGPGGLDGLGGGERPARSALLLVLDGGELALVVPVEGAGGVDNDLVGLVNGELRGLQVGVDSEVEGELVLGHVGELGDSVDGDFKLGVALGDLLDVGLEDGKPLLVLGLIGVDLSVGGFECLEALGEEHVGGCGGGGGGDGGGGGGRG